MSRITAYSFCTKFKGFDHENDTPSLLVYLNTSDGIFCLTLDEMAEITNLDTENNLRSGGTFIPLKYAHIEGTEADDYDFETVLAQTMRFAYFNNLLSAQDYCKYSLRHLKFYADTPKRVAAFYNNYLLNMLDISKNNRIFYNVQCPMAAYKYFRLTDEMPKPCTYSQIEPLLDTADRILTALDYMGGKDKRIGGENYGFWYDTDYEKNRPLTSPIQHIREYPNLERFACLFTMFLCNSDHKQVKTSAYLCYPEHLMSAEALKDFVAKHPELMCLNFEVVKLQMKNWHIDCSFKPYEYAAALCEELWVLDASWVHDSICNKVIQHFKSLGRKVTIVDDTSNTKSESILS